MKSSQVWKKMIVHRFSKLMISVYLNMLRQENPDFSQTLEPFVAVLHSDTPEQKDLAWRVADRTQCCPSFLSALPGGLHLRRHFVQTCCVRKKTGVSAMQNEQLFKSSSTFKNDKPMATFCTNYMHQVFEDWKSSP